jgi:D-tyrosyl-tRNA(Tyr) deacylase
MLDLNKRKIELFDRLSSGAETHIDQYSDAQVQKLNAARKAARKAIVDGRMTPQQASEKLVEIAKRIGAESEA